MTRPERIMLCSGAAFGAVVGSLLGALGPAAAAVVMALACGAVGHLLAPEMPRQ